VSADTQTLPALAEAQPAGAPALAQSGAS
jgi:hypothetical protein